jgi:probable addiction module antidote protein
MRKTTRFDAADNRDTEERQVDYITSALETGDTDFVRGALGLVAPARGMGQIAKNAGLNCESLYKARGETGNPELSTVMRIVRALGLTLSARPAATGRTSARRQDSKDARPHRAARTPGDRRRSDRMMFRPGPL